MVHVPSYIIRSACSILHDKMVTRFNLSSFRVISWEIELSQVGNFRVDSSFEFFWNKFYHLSTLCNGTLCMYLIKKNIYYASHIFNVQEMNYLQTSSTYI